MIRKNKIRYLSSMLAFALVIQMLCAAIFPVSTNAATTNNDNGTIAFSLPLEQIDAIVTGEFDGWEGKGVNQTVTNAVYEGANLQYDFVVTGLAPNTGYEYKVKINNEYYSGSDNNAVVTSDNYGVIHITYNPEFYVFGSFDNNWGTRNQLVLNASEDTLEYTTAALEDGTYEYKFIAVDTGENEFPDIYFTDPTNNKLSSGGNSKIIVGGSDESLIESDPLIAQPGGANQWYIAGSFQGWNNTSTPMIHLGAGFFEYSVVLDPGEYEFKIAKNGTWDGFNNNGENFELELEEPTKVNFYVNEVLNMARINVAGVENLEQYTPQLTNDEWPRIVGNIQAVFGEAEWAPEEAQQFFIDYHFDNTVYMLQRSIPVGEYEFKVTFGNGWKDDFGQEGGANAVIRTLDAADVIFSFDNSASSKAVTHDYKPKDGNFDGLINKSGIQFDSRSITFKKPFGAIPQGQQELILRIATEANDVQLAKVELLNPGSHGVSYEMKRITTVGNQDFYETVIPASVFDQIGIWGYKFILVDGVTKVEYGDDGASGGTGRVVDDGAIPFNLTVYAADFQTPDWVKNAVIYQIFPDRFFDGNEENNRAKLVDGYRGLRDESLAPEERLQSSGIPLQYFDGGVSNDPAPDQVMGDWSTPPENPDRSTPEQKPYYPDATTDGVWTNEFYGGDIQGIEQKLDYLKSIGITAIYLNPVAWAASNHKYDATDYKHLDPMFGQPVYNIPGDPTSGLDYDATRQASDEVFMKFAKAARETGLYLITDGVFNHVGDDSIYFDRYEKYPEIGAYEYWAKVWDQVNDDRLTQEQAEKAVQDEFTSQINPATGTNYAYPDDFGYTTMFTIENRKVMDGDGNSMYAYEGWWGYDSLPVFDAKEPQSGDPLAIDGSHEWNNIVYRDEVIGHDLSSMTADEAQEAMQNTVSQRWEWLGASGWRLDVAPDVSNGTWQKFRDAVKSTAGMEDANGELIVDPIILGEEWGVATRYLLGDQFDSVMNYRFRSALQNFLINGDAATMNEALESIREDYPEEAWRVMLNLVDSHDTTRHITKLDNPKYEEEKLKIAEPASERAKKLQQLTVIFQMGYPGAPTIYYGDEVGLEGTKDPDSRRAFPWERVTGSNGNYQGVGEYEEIFDVYQRAGHVRSDYEVFRTGDLRTVYAQGDIVVYARKNDTQAGLLVINKGTTEAVIDANVAGYIPNGTKFTDRLYGMKTGEVSGGSVHLTIPAETGYLMTSDEALAHVPQVANLHAAGGNGQVNLTWDALAAAEGYNIYRSLIEGGTLEQLASGITDTTYMDTDGIVNGTKYYYAVTASIGTGESEIIHMVTATPSFPIEDVTITAAAADMTIGVGQLSSEIEVTIHVPGLTDSVDLSGEAAVNLIAKLGYYLEGTDKSQALESKLRYKEDTVDGKKVYRAQFEPTEAGIYHYFAKVSTDNGETYTESAGLTFAANADSSDTEPADTPDLEEILQESNRAQLQWTVENDADIKGFDVYRATVVDGVPSAFVKIASVDSQTTHFVDYTVSNDTTYSYRIASFDQAYNRAFSVERLVTPKLVMVDVTLRLHIPDYTPATDDIYLAGDFNGWNSSGNKLTVPSGATDRSVVEYSFQMMAGKQIQYKYTRSTWDTEALTSHARKANDTEDYGNWAYSSVDTNMYLTIANQGGNQMTVDDYVLRWVDMPMIITMPRISYGEDIAYATEEASFTLKGFVPYGVDFTINGTSLSSEEMDAYGNVLKENIPLSPGVNTFILHIEPTEETLQQDWFEDQGRASQATETITMTITTPGGSGGGSNNGSDSGTPSTPQQPSGTTVITNLQDLPQSDGTIVVELAREVNQVLLPIPTDDVTEGKSIQIQKGNVSLRIPSSILQELAELLPDSARDGARISLEMIELGTDQHSQLLDSKQNANTRVAVAGTVYEFHLSVISASGEATSLTHFSQPLSLTFMIDDQANINLVGVYYLADDGNMEYVGGAIADGKIVADVHHFSAYAVLEYVKMFDDVTASFWAYDVIQQLAAKHIVEGKTDDRFDPQGKVTRAEFAAMLVRALGLPLGDDGDSIFVDVPQGAWFTPYVEAAYGANLINGVDANHFKPQDLITREEMAVMVARALDSGQSNKSSTASSGSSSDLPQVSGWARAGVQVVMERKLMQGDEHGFRPLDSSTRAESAQVIHNLLSTID